MRAGLRPSEQHCSVKWGLVPKLIVKPRGCCGTCSVATTLSQAHRPREATEIGLRRPRLPLVGDGSENEQRLMAAVAAPL